MSSENSQNKIPIVYRKSIIGFHSSHSFDLSRIYNSQSPQPSYHQSLTNEEFKTDDFFCDPFLNISVKSTPSEIEEAIAQCKSLFLDDSNHSRQYKRQLLSRLIELRALLHTTKEIKNQKLIEKCRSPSTRKRFVSESASDDGPLSLNIFSKSIVHSQNGHNFISNLLSREWGSVCETCCKSIHVSLKRYLSCNGCKIVIHWSQECMQGLTRKCPASQNNELYPLANEQPKLNIKKIKDFSANLAGQHWRCAECGRGLIPPPYSNHLKDNSFQFYIYAYQNIKPNSKMEELLSELKPLKIEINQILPAEATAFCEDLGPLCTSADAIVHTAVSKFRHSVSNSQELPPARFCHYSGFYYCPRCIWDDTRTIPALYFVLNDRQSKLVCRSSALWLDYAWKRSVFRAPNIWIRCTPIARRLIAIRLKMIRLIPHFESCLEINTLKKDALEINEFPTWMLDQPYTINMFYVDQLLDGLLIAQLEELLYKFEEHLNTNCKSCDNIKKCHSCESEDTLIVTSIDATVCSYCNKPCHRNCTSRRKSVNENTPQELVKFDPAQNTNWIDYEVFHPLMDAICKKCISL